MINNLNNTFLKIAICLFFFLSGCSSLQRAASTNDIHLLEKTISEGKEDVQRNPMPLIIAAQKGHHEIVRILLDAGANPNLTDFSNQSALMWAAFKNHPDIVDLLLKFNANPEIKESGSGQTALISSVIRQQEKIVKLLLEHGADPNLTDNKNQSALMFAAYNNHPDIVDLLLKFNADPEIKESKYGQTALISSVIKQHEDVVKLLLEHGADPNTHAKDGANSLLEAVAKNNITIVRELLEASTDVNIKNNFGTTPLIWASSKGFIDIVKLLLEHGADPTLIQYDGLSALKLAISHNFHTIAEMIRPAISKDFRHTPSFKPHSSRKPTKEFNVYTSTGWAVIIGISQYQYSGQNGLTNLLFADNDAKSFARTLFKLGWNENNIKLLVNKDATQRNITIALESWLSKAGPNDQIILFWAGHGYPNPEDPQKVYLATYDTDISIPATGYRMDRVRSILEEIKSKNVILFADTCHAGKLITRGNERRGISIVPNIDKIAQEQKIPKGWIFMVGADTDRQAIEHTSWTNGAFTHSLIKGLNGEADGFQSAGLKDGIVTMGELKDYMNISLPNETQKVLGVARRPVIMTSSGDPDIWNLTLQATQ
jgi:ankyrin repeat protein